MFLSFSRNILLPQKMFLSLRAWETFWETRFSEQFIYVSLFARGLTLPQLKNR